MYIAYARRTNAVRRLVTFRVSPVPTVGSLNEPHWLLFLAEEFGISAEEHFSYLLTVNFTFVWSTARRRVVPVIRCFVPAGLAQRYNQYKLELKV